MVAGSSTSENPRRAGHPSRWLRLATGALTVATLSCGGATEPQRRDGEGVLGEWIWFSGSRRAYELHLPTGYDESRAHPLLIVFHGAGDTGLGFQRRIDLDIAADSAGAVTVYPDGRSGSWFVEDVEFVQALIAHLEAELAIDADRLFVAGFSAGAQLTQLLGCRLAGELAGALSVAATMSSALANRCRAQRPLTFLFIHGTEDTIFPWDGVPTQLLSAEATLEAWATLYTCLGSPTQGSPPDRSDDGTRVWTLEHADCAGGARVKLYAIVGGGHTWPGAPGPFPEWTGRVSQEISGRDLLADLLSSSN